MHSYVIMQCSFSGRAMYFFVHFISSLGLVADEVEENLVSPLLDEAEKDVAKKVPRHRHRRMNNISIAIVLL